MSAKAGGKAQNYVFLICSERSGSNLISTMMAAHSKVKSPPPYHFARDVILNLQLAGGGDQASAGWPVLRDQLLKRVHMLGTEAQVAALTTWLDKHPKASVKELAEFVYTGLDPKPANTVFVKENNIHRVLFFILSVFPDAKFVFQVRDPRDYLVSAHKLRKVWLGNKFGSNRHAMTVWREDQLGGLALLGLLGAERVFFQRYEDLVSRPREVLEPLCKFLGLKFEEGMLGFHEAEGAAQRSTGSARANLSKPLMTDNFGQYRKGLSRGQIRTVEAWLGDLMDRFGYARDFPNAGKPGPLEAFGPQILEPLERLMNKELAPFYATGQKRFLAQLRDVPAPVARPYDTKA